MITTPVRVSSAQAGDYYYFDKSKENAEWGGSLADDMKLSGKCSEAEFLQMTQGYDPVSNEKLSVNAGDPERNAGEDYTFALGKNASVLGIYDERIRQAFNESVNETLKIMEERYAATQTRTDGKLKTEHTGNMLYTKFTHYDSRNGDPAIHQHVFIHNITKDANGKIKAFDYKEMYSNKTYMGVIQENILAHKLKDLGYELDLNRNKGLVDIKLADTSIKDLFSSRQKEIDAKMAGIKAKYPGLSEKEQRQIAQKETRAAKEHNSTIADVKKKVENTANPEQLQNIKSEILKAKQNHTPINETDLKLYTDEIVKNSIKDLSENKRIFKYEAIENTAIRKGLGTLNETSIKESIDGNKDLILLENGRYTTKEIKAVVRDNINAIKENKAIKIIASDRQIDKAVKDYESANNRKLSDGQKDAAALISNDKKIGIIQGDAGTGKTTSFKIIKQVAEDNGYKVVGIAPTTKAQKELKNAGINETYTIQSLQQNNMKFDDKTLLIIDESSMIGDRQAAFLLKQDSAKTIFAGDFKQFESIERGDFFKEAQQNIDKSVFVNMTEAKRFITENQKELAGAAANKEYEKVLNNLEKYCSIKTAANQEQKYNMIAEDYINNKLAGKDTILISDLNYDKDKLNEHIRGELIDKNLIDRSKSLTADVNINKNLDITAKGFSESYAAGDVLSFNENYKLDENIYFSKGTKAQITNIDGDLIYLKGTATGVYKNDNNKFDNIKQQGEYVINLSDKNKGSFSVWQTKNIELAKGDEIVFLKPDRKLDVQNGYTGTIKEIDAEKRTLTVEMENKEIKEINIDKYNNIDYGYALTNYKSQGATRQETLYSAGRNINEEGLYVMTTRATDNTRIYGTTEEIESFKSNLNDFQKNQDIKNAFDKVDLNQAGQTPANQEIKRDMPEYNISY